MATRTKSRSKAAKPAPVDEVEDDDLELEDLDEDIEEEAPKRKARNGQSDVTFGVSNLADHLTKVTGKKVTPRELRAQIRRMARDGSGRISREIIPGNKTRYDWPKGLEDPEVKAIIKAVKGGEIEAGKKEALDKLKASQAQKRAAGEKTGKAAKRRKAKAKAPVEDDEDIDEDFEDDDE